MPANARGILIEALRLRDAHRWLDELLSDPRLTLESLASREGWTCASDPDDPAARFPRAGDRQGAVEGRLPRRFGLKRATRMTLESRDEAPTFETVAHLIAEEEGDVQWLVNGLRGWIWPEERYPASARKYGHGRGMSPTSPELGGHARTCLRR